MRKGRRLGIMVAAGLGLLMTADAEGQTQARRPPRARDDAGMDGRMLADLEILRDLELLKQLDLLRRMEEVRTESPPRAAGPEEKGRP